MPAGYLSERQAPEPYVYEPIYYFFYGTLMKPNILKGVLNLQTEPILRPAKVYGYELTNWGQYKALVDGESGTALTGCAYLVESLEHEYRLATYETGAYTLKPCSIYFTDGPGGREDDRPTAGKTFMYAGDAVALKEGRFDRLLWELQMGTRLPPEWGRGGAGRE